MIRLICFTFLFGWVSSALPIIEAGQAQAEIVIAPEATRATRLAARELQANLEQISGARLKIVSEPSGQQPIRLYVGPSDFTRQQGITADDLEGDAYRLVSGEDWLVFMGQDADFVPVEPWGRNHRHWLDEKQAEWDALSGAKWANALAHGLYREYHKELDLWRYDQRGTLNAVYGFLRDLGFRWYMPGELGTITPRQATIELPEIDRTVRPDIEIRTVNFARYHVASVDDILYDLRLGSNRVFAPMHHGLRIITERQEQRQLNPDFYQLINGRRDTESRTANECLSSEGLFEETVRHARLMFDHYNVPIVSVMPHDGFTTICQCDGCRDQATIDRGYSGWFSDYVWDFVNRVATEIARTHPDRRIICSAYSTYQLPPLKIDKLHPNLLVQITNGRPVSQLDDAAHEERLALRRAWLEKTDNPLSISMNYPFTQRSEYRPCYFPHIIARGIRESHDHIWREDVWLPERRGMHLPGVNHLNAYVLGRLWWDAEQDVDALLAEYYRLYYGPAAGPMQQFIEHCEANFQALAKDGDVIDQALTYFAAAYQQAPEGSVYAQRLALVDDYLEDLRNRRQQLDRRRGPVPEFRAYSLANNKWAKAKANMKLDGKLDEPWWIMRAGLSNMHTGASPGFPTAFGIVVDTNAIYIGITCTEPDAPLITGDDGNPSIWNGDHIELFLETDKHSYYQLVINPDGAVLDLDRGAAKSHWFNWSSEAEVGSFQGDGFWSLEIRIPFTEDDADPLHMIVGTRPTTNLPWFFNICRQRPRPNGREATMYSPSGTSFDDASKFGKLYTK